MPGISGLASAEERDIKAGMPDAGPREPTFAVTYDPLTNRQLTGSGRVTVRDDETGGRSYVFSGRTRRPFSRAETVISLTPDRIRNVERAGAQVRFTTDLMERAGLKPQVFAFRCEREEDAAALTLLLPDTVDATLVAEREFADRLSRLPHARRPWTSLTGMIVVVNVIVFVVMAAFFDAGWIDANLAPYARLGANNGAATTDGEWWRLVTSMFMHFGLLHVALNMWALFDTGRLLERLAGRASYALLYFGSGVGGSLASIFWNGNQVWSAGASGAVFGVYGALLGYVLREKGSLPSSVFKPFLNSSLLFIGYNLVYGFAHAGIDNAAHVGGLVTGLALGWLTALPLERERREPLFRRRFLAGVAAMTVIVTVGVAATPRFDYRVRDEIALGELLDRIGSREERLAERHAQSLKQYLNRGDNAAEFAAWIESEFLPFYEDFSARLAALDFAKGRSTERRREVLLEFTRARIEGARQLLAALRTGDAGALQAYEAAEARAHAAAEKLQAER